MEEVQGWKEIFPRGKLSGGHITKVDQLMANCTWEINCKQELGEEKLEARAKLKMAKPTEVREEKIKREDMG